MLCPRLWWRCGCDSCFLNIGAAAWADELSPRNRDHPTLKFGCQVYDMVKVTFCKRCWHMDGKEGWIGHVGWTRHNYSVGQCLPVAEPKIKLSDRDKDPTSHTAKNCARLPWSCQHIMLFTDTRPHLTLPAPSASPIGAAAPPLHPFYNVTAVHATTSCPDQRLHLLATALRSFQPPLLWPSCRC